MTTTTTTTTTTWGNARNFWVPQKFFSEIHHPSTSSFPEFYACFFITTITSTTFISIQHCIFVRLISYLSRWSNALANVFANTATVDAAAAANAALTVVTAISIFIHFVNGFFSVCSWFVDILFVSLQFALPHKNAPPKYSTRISQIDLQTIPFKFDCIQ